MATRIPPKPKRSTAAAKPATSRKSASPKPLPPAARKHFAVIGAGMAGIVCARTLQQAGHKVTVLESQLYIGGRMGSHHTPHGSFDIGAQFFTVRDPRFQQALDTTPNATRRWSVNAIRTLDATGKAVVAIQKKNEPHLVGSPTMESLLDTWAEPLNVHTGETVLAFERDALNDEQWQLHCADDDGGVRVYAGVDGIVLAIPPAEAQAMLEDSEVTAPADWNLNDVYVAPSWTMLLTFAHAVDPTITAIGPQWNAARSEHPRINWVVRESSKPGRGKVERWTVQASPDWALKHENDDPQRVADKLLQAFADVTHIRAKPTDIRMLQWAYAKTINPLTKDAKGKSRSHLWSADSQIGVCGDWCLGYRVEDAFVSGLELALQILRK